MQESIHYYNAFDNSYLDGLDYNYQDKDDNARLHFKTFEKGSEYLPGLFLVINKVERVFINHRSFNPVHHDGLPRIFTARYKPG